MTSLANVSETLPSKLTPDDVLSDYRVAYRSRQVSTIARSDVFMGRATFGIFGDGKEVAQVALARALQPGDIRAGYYRDQTLMFALGLLTVQQFFAQLYAHADVEADPASAGRGMNAHFATRMLDDNGNWLPLTSQIHSSGDVSPTASQMPRLLGLALASKLYRQLDSLKSLGDFSRNGNELAFGTIGNASCAEGMFWESLNAAGVLQVPMLLSIWDDGYGISVPNELQITKGDISELLKGFQRVPGKTGFDLQTVRGWDYKKLIEVYRRTAQSVRREHVPAVVHVIELTQPHGHSTSGSHERYKNAERLGWEKEFDGLTRMRAWIEESGIATADELTALETEERDGVRATRDAAWQAYQSPITEEIRELSGILTGMAGQGGQASEELKQIAAAIEVKKDVSRRDVAMAAHSALIATRGQASIAQPLHAWVGRQERDNDDRFHSHLYSEGDESALHVPEVRAVYAEDAPVVDGFRILNACFDAALRRDPRVLAFGEDVGRLGDVNQAFADLQKRYGELRVGDAGIRECTIVGQAIGLAMRGLRPIAEIQYLDYILYATQIMSDDLSTLRYRTKGGQKAPVIVRTRGHRLVGIWHSGSPMAALVHLLRGMHVLVPRDMTTAAGFYNTLLQSDEPGLVIEVLNGYRLKERLPSNIDTLTTPIGVCETLRTGRDVTIVTYGACCPIAMEAAKTLERTVGIDVEVIDVQSLLPFDLRGSIVESLKKTNRVLFFDEDVPGGATAYMMQEVLERQNGYDWLDAAPRTLTASAHRPAYGKDGDYWSKPNAEQVFDAVYDIMREGDPARYPAYRPE